MRELSRAGVRLFMRQWLNPGVEPNGVALLWARPLDSDQVIEKSRQTATPSTGEDLSEKIVALQRRPKVDRWSIGGVTPCPVRSGRSGG